MLLTEVEVRNRIKVIQKAIAKENKVKASYGGFYAKTGDYFWTIGNAPYSYNSRQVLSGIKPWSWDESLDAIVHPYARICFTDLSRWAGGAAMRLYYFPREIYAFETEWDNGKSQVEESELYRITRDIFSTEKAKLDGFINMVETQYADFDEYCIANADYTPSMYDGLLYAGFAAVRKKRYEQAIEFLTKAKGAISGLGRFNTFNFSYGRYDRDLRDVLIDYSRTMLENSEWTYEKIVGEQDVTD